MILHYILDVQVYILQSFEFRLSIGTETYR